LDKQEITKQPGKNKTPPVPGKGSKKSPARFLASKPKKESRVAVNEKEKKAIRKERHDDGGRGVSKPPEPATKTMSKD